MTLLENYIEHCTNDLDLPLDNMNSSEKELYVMFQWKKFNTKVIALLLNTTQKKIELKLAKLLKKTKQIDLDRLGYDETIHLKIKSLIKQNSMEKNCKQIKSLVKKNIKCSKKHIYMALYI